MNQDHAYEEMCRRAATGQGLDPIAERLTAEGIPYGVEQTGGFVMLIRIPLAEPAWIGVTASDEQPGGAWCRVLYHDDDDEGTLLSHKGSDCWPADEAVATIQDHLAMADRGAASAARETPTESDQPLRHEVDGLLHRIDSLEGIDPPDISL